MRENGVGKRHLPVSYCSFVAVEVPYITGHGCVCVCVCVCVCDVFQLGHTQKELARLQEQNSLLREQLQDARGREHSAREGYVLQVGFSGGSVSL